MVAVAPMEDGRGRRSTTASAWRGEADAREKLWTEDDAIRRDIHLRRLLRCKPDSSNYHYGMLCSPYDPMLGMLLCMPRDKVQGRMHNIVSGVSVVYGLLLSGVAGSALDPISVDEFAKEPDKLALANFANFAASLQFTLCLSGSVLTTFVLVIINSQPDATIFRVVAQMDWFLTYCYLCFYSAYLLMAQLCAVIYIRSSPYWAYATIAGVLVMFQVLLNHWQYGVKRAFPNFSLHLFPLFAINSFNPWTMSWLFGKRWSEHRKTSQHTANVMIQDAENNFGKDVINKVRHDVASERARDARGDNRQGTADDEEGVEEEDGLEALFALAKTNTPADNRKTFTFCCEDLLVDESVVMQADDTIQTAFQRAFADHEDVSFDSVDYVLIHNDEIGRDMKIMSIHCGKKRLLDYAECPDTWPKKVFKVHMKDDLDL